ncbi:c-type cytochrome biogenesis protein CcsB [Glycomyces buryatensis]|uniref:C-type cytochrome biogenesis protein CcsB n=1 Tax=Glycomyces buryatensis TaxID=2570927 RepID=A0A4S8QRP2_9ACTN|nr:c-type cytochrome biogenesis protein CcsB [Glycomyces buryatensis]THV43314.1 c-type cytochrome biogenesis protein CcsB [Glycomyces buryatensis]
MTGAEAANALFVATILTYAAAMFAYALEYAFDKRASKAVGEKELVAAGNAVIDRGTSADSADSGAESAPITPSAARGAGRIGLVLTFLGTAALAASIITRVVYTGRWPWGNMFEYTVGVALAGMVTWLVLVSRGTVPRRLGLFATFAVTMVLGTSVRVYTEAGPLVPALDSYWIIIHVTAAIAASGILLIGCVFAILHLIKRRYDRQVSDGKPIRFPLNIAERLPDATALERLTFKIHVFAFPLLTFGIFAGSVWAHFAWGRYWNWDPKEVWAFIAWVVYAAYLHARVSGKSMKANAPWIAILGYAVMIFNLTAVNLVFDGLHSYSGV